MCFDHDSLPPVPVIRGAAVSHDDLVLEAADGNRFAAFVAEPDEPGGAGVVILPDVRGLYRFYEELALRFAERGYPAIAFDFYGRSAGAEKRGEDFVWQDHLEPLTGEQIQLDVAASAAELRRRGASTLVTVGFCLGGRHSWLAAAAGTGSRARSASTGGRASGRDGEPGPAQRAARSQRRSSA